MSAPRTRNLEASLAREFIVAHDSTSRVAEADSLEADAEDAQIRGTLASLIKLTLTKLEMKMSQFEELEDILEDERKNLESARIALMSERLSLKKMLEQTREQLVAHGAAVPSQLGTTGQGPIANEVQNVDMGGPSGPVPDGSMLQLS